MIGYKVIKPFTQIINIKNNEESYFVSLKKKKDFLNKRLDSTNCIRLIYFFNLKYFCFEQGNNSFFLQYCIKQK